MNRYTNKTEITQAEYITLVGLLTIASTHLRRLQEIVPEIERITGEEKDSTGHSSDAVYCGYSADEMLDKLGIKVVEKDDPLRQWQQYAAYCNCCAKSGEHTPMDFDAFLARSIRHDGQNAIFAQMYGAQHKDAIEATYGPGPVCEVCGQPGQHFACGSP